MYNTFAILDNMIYHCWAWVNSESLRMTGTCPCVISDFTGSFEYKKANGSQYIYNSNGSLVADRSRGIAYITYDANNNPQTIYFTNGNEIRYTYSGTEVTEGQVHVR